MYVWKGGAVKLFVSLSFFSEKLIKELLKRTLIVPRNWQFYSIPLKIRSRDDNEIVGRWKKLFIKDKFLMSELKYTMPMAA